MKKKELNYFDEFIKNVDICCEISNIIKQHLNNFKNEDAKETERIVHKLENDADLNLHNIKNYLIKDFLPPIEREDIVLLVNKIDDVIDNLDEIIIDLNIFNVNYLRDDFKEFVELICQMSIKLRDIMNSFKERKKYEQIINMIIEINGLEEQGDKLFENSIKNLYNTEHNPVEILKWHNIYTTLEEAIDSFESVADYIEEIIMKNF
ncbi:MAG TPA: hypothetical protein DEP51_04355 [Clostridiales bacterium]|nr:hypothetical protein [Clostridiales bacterium]